MAYDPAIAEEIRKRQMEDALSPPSDDSEQQPEADTEQTPIDIGKKGGYDYELIPVDQPKAPTIAQDQPEGPPKLAPTPIVPGLITDPESGTRYVKDPSAESGIVPYAEPATKTDEEAFKPGDVALPQSTVQGPAPRAQLIDPDPDRNILELNRSELPDQQPTQVEKALPAHEPAPDQLAQTEKAQPVQPVAAVKGGEGFWGGDLTQGPPGTKPDGTDNEPYWPKSDKDVALLPPGANYIDPKDQSQKVTPGTPAKISQVSAPPQQPTQPSEIFGMPVRGAKPAPAAVADVQPDNAEPMLNAPNGQAPSALIIHHTSGNNSAASVVEDWRTNRPGVGAQMIMDRDGTIHYTQKEFGYNGTGNFLHSVIPGVSNQTAVGIEVIAKDDADMTPAQLASLQRLAGPKGPYANVRVFGHSQVSPGDRENEGVRGVNAINEARKSGVAAAGDQATASTDGDYVSGKATTFGYKDKGDPGVGAPRLGTISTNDPDLVGIAVPEQALRQRLGANPALWRTARVEVVTPDGRHMLVPIVDLGPKDTSGQRGVAADFTQKLHSLLGNTGEETYKFKIVPNAGADVEKNPQAFIAEQRQLMTGADTRPKPKGASSYELIPVDKSTAQPAAPIVQEQGNSILDSINEQTPNRGEFWKKLNTDIPGVSPQAQQNYRNKVRQQITDYAMDYYKESNPNIKPDEAFKLATGDADFGTLAGEVGSKLVPNLTKAAIALERSQGTIDENRVMTFLKTLNPNVDPDKLVEIKRQLMAEPREDRAIQINHLIQMSGQEFPGLDPTTIADSFDRISDPDYQAKRKAALDVAVAKNTHDLRTDPRLVNTAAEGVTQWLASAPKNISEMLSGPIGQSMMLSETYVDTEDQIRKENPGWSEDDIRAKARASTIAQLGPQEIIALATGGAMSALTKGISQPLMELGARLGLHGTVAGVAGGIQRLAKNAVEGHPLMEGVMEATASNIPFGMIGGALHGRTPVEAKPEAAPAKTEEIKPEVKPAEPPPKAEEPVTPPEPPPEPPPRVEREVPPPEDRPEASEEELNKQSDALDRKMSGAEEPPEPKEQAEVPDHAPPSDDANNMPERPAEPAVEKPPVEEPPPKVEPPPEPPPPPVEPPPPAEPPPRQARTPSINDIKVTPEERAALAPETAELKRVFKQGQKDGWSAPNIQEFTQAYKTFQDKAFQKWQPHLDALEVKSQKDNPRYDPKEENHLAAGIDHVTGDMYLHNNVDTLAQRVINVMQNGGDPVQDAHMSMREELIHFAHLKAVRDQWDKSPAGIQQRNAMGDRQGVGGHILDHSRKVINNTFDAIDNASAKGDASTAEMLRKALVNSRKMYSSDTGAHESAVLSGWRNDLRKANAGDYQAQGRIHSSTAELVRQLAQAGRKGGHTTEGVFQKMMTGVKEWYQTALQGLKDLYRQLKPGQTLAKTELARLIKAVEKEVKAIDRKVAEGKPADIQSAVSKMTSIADEIRRAKAGDQIVTAVGKKGQPHEWRKLWKQTFAGGESAMLDHEETKGLARGIKRRASAEQEIGARIGIHQYVEAWKKVPGKERTRVTNEFKSWIEAEQTGKPKPPIGTDTERLIQMSKDVKEKIGTEMDRLNVHVKDSKGAVRKARLIGRDYFPRKLTEDFKDMIERREGARAGDFNGFVAREIGRGKAKSRDEVIDRYTRQDPGDEYSNEPFSNMEKARENHTPHEGVDYHPNADFHYMSHAMKRLAQIDSFGQKLSNKGRDLHDIAINKVEQSGTLSRRAKDIIINRIHEQSRNEYGNLKTNPLNGISANLRSFAGASFLGNPITSFYNALSGGAHNLVYGGARSFARTGAHLMDPRNMVASLKEAHDRNILRDNMHEMIHDLDLAHDQGWMTKGVRGYNSNMMKWGGQNLTEGLNRAFAMQQGKFWLREMSKNYGRDTAKQRHMMGQLERLNFNKSEIHDLYNEKGQGPKTDEFLRQWVLQTHGSYDASQTSPKIFDHPVGKVLMQFQKWSANAGRVYIREFAAPFAKSMADLKKNPTSGKAQSDFLYHLGRQLAYLGVGYGAGSLAIAGRQMMTGAAPQDATNQDIIKLAQQGKNGEALQEALGKAWHGLIMSGFMGTAGNYADLLQSFAGQAKGLRVKDPRSFAVLGVIQPLLDFAQSTIQEQTLGPMAPSQNTAHKLFDGLSSMGRTTLPIGLNAMNHMGIKTAWGDEMKGKNDYQALKMHLAQYESQQPELIQKAAQQGNKQITATGRSVADPVREDVQRNLVSGNEEGVRTALNNYLLRLPAPARGAALKAFKQSIRMKNPVNPGGSNSLESAVGFLSWAKNNLPMDEARQLFAAARTYASTAMKTGIFEATPGTALPWLASVDYDKFQARQAKAKADVAAAKNLGTFLAREKAKEQLQHR
jgi:N-acetylmuramoyl-L-alanine amidase